MIFRLYTVYNKHEMIKNDNQTREKLQGLSQVLEYFCCRLYTLIIFISFWLCCEGQYLKWFMMILRSGKQDEFSRSFIRFWAFSLFSFIWSMVNKLMCKLIFLMVICVNVFIFLFLWISLCKNAFFFFFYNVIRLISCFKTTFAAVARGGKSTRKYCFRHFSWANLKKKFHFSMNMR